MIESANPISKSKHAVTWPKSKFTYTSDEPRATNILSQREQEILKLLALGMTSKEIGTLLSVSNHTVDTHRRNIIQKLNVKNSIGCINRGRALGLL